MKFNKAILLVVSLLFLTAALPGVAKSQETVHDDWQFSAAIYLWGASIGGNTGSGSEIDVEFEDILDKLSMAFMGTFGASKGKWTLLTDLIYLNAEDDKTQDSGLELSAEVTSWIVTPGLAYNLADTENFRFDILGGARYFYLKTDLGLGSRSTDESGSHWDGILGVKGSLNLGKNFYIPYYGDIGVGESDFTWQAYGGIGLRFERVDIELAYRHLEYRLDDKLVVEKVNFSGPLAGIKFKF
jgi:hypothetical protein